MAGDDAGAVRSAVDFVRPGRLWCGKLGTCDSEILPRLYFLPVFEELSATAFRVPPKLEGPRGMGRTCRPYVPGASVLRGL